MSDYHTLYVCPQCSTAYCHRLIWCHNCGGKLEQKKFHYEEIDWNKPGASKKWDKWLDSIGVKDGGL